MGEREWCLHRDGDRKIRVAVTEFGDCDGFQLVNVDVGQPKLVAARDVEWLILALESARDASRYVGDRTTEGSDGGK